MSKNKITDISTREEYSDSMVDFANRMSSDGGGGMGTRLEMLEHRMNGVEQRLDRVESRLDALTEKVGELSGKISALPGYPGIALILTIVGAALMMADRFLINIPSP